MPPPREFDSSDSDSSEGSGSSSEAVAAGDGALEAAKRAALLAAQLAQRTQAVREAPRAREAARLVDLTRQRAVLHPERSRMQPAQA